MVQVGNAIVVSSSRRQQRAFPSTYRRMHSCRAPDAVGNVSEASAARSPLVSPYESPRMLIWTTPATTGNATEDFIATTRAAPRIDRRKGALGAKVRIERKSREKSRPRRSTRSVWRSDSKRRNERHAASFEPLGAVIVSLTFFVMYKPAVWGDTVGIILGAWLLASPCSFISVAGAGRSAV